MGIILLTLGLGGKVAGFLSPFILPSKASASVLEYKHAIQSGSFIFIGLAVLGAVICLLIRPLFIKVINNIGQ